MQYCSDEPDRPETRRDVVLAVAMSLVLAAIYLAANHLADAPAQPIDRNYADEITIKDLGDQTYVKHGKQQCWADPGVIEIVTTMDVGDHTELFIYSYGRRIQRFDFRNADKAAKAAQQLQRIDNLPAHETNE